MDLDLRRVIKSIPKEHEPIELNRLTTPWGERIGDEPVFRSHPRPLLARTTWQSLDGWWDCAFQSLPDASLAWRSAAAPAAFDLRIRVPFSPEAALSGVGRSLQPDELLWYRRSFASPELGVDECCLLHFDGVDHACAVYVNGRRLGEHRGAYLPFEVDVTDVLRGASEENELLVCVYDPSEAGTQLRGKQRLARGGMWYTAQSGIWQSVWLEVVPRTHVRHISYEVDLTTGELALAVEVEGIAVLSAELLDEGRVLDAGVQSRRIDGRMRIVLHAPTCRLWTPDNPKLYDLRVCYGSDEVKSYVAFRTVGIETSPEGQRRFCLNHRPFFIRALLDQGYWPDGLMTAPGEEAMAFDLRVVRDAGFDAIRKHIKVEPARFYALCDQMGVLVLQDMPSGGDVPSDRWARDLPTLHRKAWHTHRDDTPRSRERFGASDETYRDEWTKTCRDVVRRLSGHPSVVSWVLFNESWGQFDSAAADAMVRTLDPTRPILAASGWYDQGVGDIRGIHNYFRVMKLFADPYARRADGPGRAQMMSEFGGLVWSVDGHRSVPYEYGYAQFETPEEWQDALSRLLMQADALRLKGLSGFVYTQLSDVEEETNGLVTYDRRVNKLR